MNNDPVLDSSTANRTVKWSAPEGGAGGVTTLVLRGTLAGVSLGVLADALETVLLTRPKAVRLDLTDLEDWSLVAQAMVLSAARTLAGRGGELVLVKPSAALRLQGARIGVFGRVRTLDYEWCPTPAVANPSEAALVALEGRRALLVRRSDDPILRLPGGPVNEGNDARNMLAGYVAAQLGISCDDRTFLPSTVLPGIDPGAVEPYVRLVCFQAPFSARILERASTDTELVWADHRTPGVFTATAQSALSLLYDGGYID